tara:strand:+ start:1475 stop:1582 length:108 start_codon:yes stop_codon:yes gene_type:complete
MVENVFKDDGEQADSDKEGLRGKELFWHLLDYNVN